MGTPAFAVPSLEALTACATVVGVVSQPDKPKGRGLAAHASPVARAANARGIPLLQPTTLRTAAATAALAAWEPDLLVVAAYGKLLPDAVLALPSVAPINVHASLLPRHRGAAPIQSAIVAGDAETGITIMRITSELDAGDMLLQRALPIADDETGASLTARLAALGGTALAEAITCLRTAGLDPRPQDPAAVTYAPRLTRASGRVDWRESADVLARKVRAFTPWPAAFTGLGGRTVKILAAEPVREPTPAAPPGTVVAVDDTHVRVATGAGALALATLQMEGKRAVPAPAFARGARLVHGTRFDG
jgi:methionyl-tRNA formyltransferase